MGKVHFLDPVDYISGKISKKFITVYNRRRWSDKRYTSVHGDRSIPANANEMAIRNRFKVCRQAAQNRSMDLSHLTQDQIAFINERKAQGSAFKYSTYRGWLFGKAWKNFNESTNQVVWPASLNG